LAAQDEAEEVAAGVTAFSKEIKLVRGEGKGELTELQRAMLALEEVEDEEAYDAQMMDDEFVLQATERDAVDDNDDEDGDDGGDEDGEEFSSGVESGSEEEEEGIRGYPGYKGDGASLASSYWRKERKDRNEQLSMIDERFERLAFQYDEDQIGELEEEEEMEMRGASEIGHFEGILDEFIEKNVRGPPFLFTEQ
jgi:protein LTV1